METNKLKTLDLTKKTFTANGKIYYIESGMSIERYFMYEMLQIELGYQVSFKSMFDNLTRMYDLLNKMKFADSAVIVHNLLTGIKDIEKRRIPALQMCALFVNEENEDRKVITDEMVERKIADWEAEGLDIIPFFQLATSSMPGFSVAYNGVSQIISNLKGAEEILKKEKDIQEKPVIPQELNG